MKCKYCDNNILILTFFLHYLHCKRIRKKLVNAKKNRSLTVPTNSLIQLVVERFEQINNVLSNNIGYYNVTNLLSGGKLSLDEAVAVNELFWFAKTPFYGDEFVSGWLCLGVLRKYDDEIYAVCSDWRTGPPDSTILPINLIPAEILVEALSMVGENIKMDQSFGNGDYQTYLFKQFEFISQ